MRNIPDSFEPSVILEWMQSPIVYRADPAFVTDSLAPAAVDSLVRQKAVTREMGTSQAAAFFREALTAYGPKSQPAPA